MPLRSEVSALKNCNDVSARPYCARKFTRTSHIEGAPSNKMIGQKAIVIILSGFNDLGRSVIPIFLLMDHFPFQFSTFSEKNDANLSIRSLVLFLENAPSNSVLIIGDS